MAERVMRKGYFSILRWRDDVARDEATNIGVILVDPEGDFARLRRVPEYKMSESLRQQGILRSLLDGLNDKLESGEGVDLGYLHELHESFKRSLVVTEPEPVVVTDREQTLEALYSIYLKPRGGAGGGNVTRGTLLTKASAIFTNRGYQVRRNKHVQSYPFGLVIQNGNPERPSVAEALSFASSATTERKWQSEERVAGSFIFYTSATGLPRFAVVEPPSKASLKIAYDSYERVMKWFEAEKVPSYRLSELEKVSVPSD